MAAGLSRLAPQFSPLFYWRCFSLIEPVRCTLHPPAFALGPQYRSADNLYPVRSPDSSSTIGSRAILKHPHSPPPPPPASTAMPVGTAVELGFLFSGPPQQAMLPPPALVSTIMPFGTLTVSVWWLWWAGWPWLASPYICPVKGVNPAGAADKTSSMAGNSETVK